MIEHRSQWLTESRLSAVTWDWKNSNEGFACNEHLYKVIINKLKKQFGTHTSSSANWRTSSSTGHQQTISSDNQTFLHIYNHLDKDTARTYFETHLNSTTVLTHASEKMPHSKELKETFVLRRQIQQSTLADFNQWHREIAEADER